MTTLTILANNLLIPLVTIAALTVLAALGTVAASAVIPVIVGLAGVHIGASSTAAMAQRMPTAQRDEKTSA